MKLILLFLLSLTAQANQKDFPKIVEASGVVLISTQEGTSPKAQKGVLLRGGLTVETKANSHLRIQTDPVRFLYIEPETEIVIPGISWESGEFTEVQLKKGRVRLRSEQKGPFPVQIVSELFLRNWPVGDLVYEFDPKLGSASLYMLQGESDFASLNADEIVQVKAGQKVRFQGVFEDRELAYDLLLHGKKVAKGVMGPVEKLGQVEVKTWDLLLEKKQKDAEIAQKKMKKESQNKLGPGQICRDPFAKLDDCAWLCRNNPKSEKKACAIRKPGVYCERVRCLADGKWGDPYKLPVDEASVQCQLQAKVTRCNY